MRRSGHPRAWRAPPKTEGCFAYLAPAIAALGAGAAVYGATRAQPKINTPTPPNPDSAANAAQAQQDELRQRRGLLANIYAGGSQQPAPAVGKTMLGT